MYSNYESTSDSDYSLYFGCDKLLIGASAKAEGLSAEEQQFVKKAAAGGLAE